MSTLPNIQHAQLRRLVQETVGDGTDLDARVTANEADIAELQAEGKAGWGAYWHTGAASVVPAEGWTDVPQDRGTSVLTYLPDAVTSLVDSDGYVDLTEVAVGDAVIIAPEIQFTTTVTNAIFRVRYTYGTASERIVHTARLDAGCSYVYSPQCDFVLPVHDSTINSNPVKIQVWCNEEGSVDCNYTYIQVIES